MSEPAAEPAAASGSPASTSPASTSSPAAAESPWAPAYRVVTLALVTLTTMIAFEAMAVTTAMPRAADELGAVGSYGLAFSSMMTAMLLGNVLVGRWADRVGPLPGLYAGQALFVAGSVLAALASTWPVLLGARVVAGLGAGFVVVTEFVAVGRVYPAHVRPRVFTWLSAAWVVPSIVGAPAAGWLTTSLSWRWVFGVVVVPAVVAAVLVTARRTALDPRGGVSIPDRDCLEGSDAGHNDVTAHRRAARLGTVVAVSAGLLQWGIQQIELVRSTTAAARTATGEVGGEVGLNGVSGLGGLGGPVALVVLGLLGVALAAPRLLPSAAVRAARGLPSVVVSRALFNASFMATVTFLPLQLVQRYGLNLAAAGAVVAVGALGWSAGSWLQGRARTGTAGRVRLVWSGAVALTIGTLGLAQAAATTAPVAVHCLWMVLCGLGMGIGSTTLSVLLLDLAPGHEHGQASAALQLCDVLGSVLGIAAATAAFGALHRPGEPGVFAIIELGLAAVAVLAVVTGRRCAPRDSQRAST
jgi:MFS family permease